MELREYQQRAVRWGRQNPCGYYAVDMGLGKTAILSTLIEVKKPTLVIAPRQVTLMTWPEELEKWRPDVSYKVLHGKTRVLDMNHDVYLLNFDGLSWLAKWPPEYAAFFRGGTLIIDEGTFVKSSSTTRFKLLKKLAPLFARRYILSGTPRPNSVQDVWSQYFLLDQGAALGKSVTAFRRAYMEPDPYVRFVWHAKSGAEDAVAQKVSAMTFRLAQEDYLQLPEKIYTKTPVDLPAASKKRYQELLTSFVTTIQTEGVAVASSAACSMKLRQLVQGGVYAENGDYLMENSAKLDALEERVESYGEPVMVCVQFRSEVAAIRSRFPRARFIVGGTPPEEAQAAARDWNTGTLPLLVVHPQSVGHGLNLQHGGHYLIWLGLPWNLEHYLQTNGRLWRSGQTKPVIIDHIVARGTIDMRVLRALETKESVQKAFLDLVQGG